MHAAPTAQVVKAAASSGQERLRVGGIATMAVRVEVRRLYLLRVTTNACLSAPRIMRRFVARQQATAKRLSQRAARFCAHRAQRLMSSRRFRTIRRGGCERYGRDR